MANVARINNLVLTMDCGEPVELRVGDIVAQITITEVRFGKVRISFRAPRAVAIVRANAKRKNPKGNALVTTAVWSTDNARYEIHLDSPETGSISYVSDQDGNFWTYADCGEPVVGNWFMHAQINYAGGPRDGDISTERA